MLQSTTRRLAVASIALAAILPLAGTAPAASPTKTTHCEVVSIDADTGVIQARLRNKKTVSVDIGKCKFYSFRDYYSFQGQGVGDNVTVWGPIASDESSMELRLYYTPEGQKGNPDGVFTKSNRAKGFFEKEGEEYFLRAGDKRLRLKTTENSQYMVFRDAKREDIGVGSRLFIYSKDAGDNITAHRVYIDRQPEKEFKLKTGEPDT